jgi:hypothetical protein
MPAGSRLADASEPAGLLMLGHVDASIGSTREQQQEVLQAVRDRDLSLTRLRGRPQALVLQGYGRRIFIHGGLRCLTLVVVQRFGVERYARLR